MCIGGENACPPEDVGGPLGYEEFLSAMGDPKCTISGVEFTKQKAPHREMGGFFNSSLTMTYFHTGTRTIIGAEMFHCPVRDGKEWDHLAMVIRLERGVLWCRDSALSGKSGQDSQFAEPPTSFVERGVGIRIFLIAFRIQ